MESPRPPSIDVASVVRAARRELFARSFAHFVRYFWPVVEPTRDLLPSVALDGMCAAAQAWADGRIKRLAVSTCPGTAKSVVWAVMLPAFILLRTGGAARVMVGSYSWGFATRDSQRCRDLVQSPQYRELAEWTIRDDANHKDDWWTTATGRRLITSVDGKSTGERCTWQIIDDALSAADIFSNPAKLEAIRWVNQVLTSRLEDQRSDPRVIVGQRLCDDDPIADVLRRQWRYLELPAVLDEGRAGCVLLDDAGIEVWHDPRKPGEPIVELLDLPALERLRLELGTLAFSAQYLQRPLPAGGGMFKRSWFTDKIVDAAPPGGHAVRGWDLAATADTSADATAGVKLRMVDGRIYVEHCRWLQGSPHEVDDAITETAALDGRGVDIDIPQDPGQAGKAQRSYYASKLVGYNVRFSPETGSKETRAAPFAAQCEAGNVYLVRGQWNDPWLDELEGFPAIKLKDRVDATSRSFAALVEHQSGAGAATFGLRITA